MRSVFPFPFSPGDMHIPDPFVLHGVPEKIRLGWFND
jgi:hypothetical protein